MSYKPENDQEKTGVYMFLAGYKVRGEITDVLAKKGYRDPSVTYLFSLLIALGLAAFGGTNLIIYATAQREVIPLEAAIIATILGIGLFWKAMSMDQKRGDEKSARLDRQADQMLTNALEEALDSNYRAKDLPGEED